MADPAISMAILTVDTNRLGRDVLSRFEPMALDRLYHSGAELVSVPELQADIESEFGLKIPGAALQTISRRASRNDLLKRENNVLLVDRDRLAEYDLSNVRASARRAYEALVRLGSDHALRFFDHELTPDRFGTALWSFVERHASPLLAAMVDDAALPSMSQSVEPLDLIVASFVVEVQEGDPEAFEYLSYVAKGAIVASALYFPDPAEFEARLDGLALYLDTTILLRLVGASGPDLQALAADLARLATIRGAKLACFEHNIREVRGVLAACAKHVKRRDGSYYGEASEHMVSTGWETAEVHALSDSLEELLEASGVEVKLKPPHVDALTVDESLLEETLQEHVHYANPSARLKDLDSITAIYRLRKGRSSTRLSKTRAVFVTNNTALVRAGRAFEKLDDIDRGSIPLCMPDFSLTTHLWVSQQIEAPDMPIRSLVADSYSVMRADDHVWRLYLEKVEELRTSRKVTDVDYVLLRQSLQVRSLIMHETHQDPDAFTEGTVRRVLEHARRTIQNEALVEAAVAREEATAANTRTATVKADARERSAQAAKKLAARDQETQRVVRKVARAVSVSLLALIGLCAIVGAIVAVPFVSNGAFSGWVGLGLAICVLVYAALSLLNLFFEVGIPSIFRSLQNAVYRRVLTWYRRAAAE